jgi:hypothetical protein
MKENPLILVEPGIPIPHGYGTMALLRRTIEAMSVGDSFAWRDQKEPLRCAKQIGVSITTRKTNDGCRVWRVDKTALKSK